MKRVDDDEIAYTTTSGQRTTCRASLLRTAFMTMTTIKRMTKEEAEQIIAARRGPRQRTRVSVLCTVALVEDKAGQKA